MYKEEKFIWLTVLMTEDPRSSSPICLSSDEGFFWSCHNMVEKPEGKKSCAEEKCGETGNQQGPGSLFL